MPREGDAGTAPSTPVGAPEGGESIAITDLPGEAAADAGEPPPGPEAGPDSGVLQRELDLVPPPDEAGAAATGSEPEADGASARRGGDPKPCAAGQRRGGSAAAPASKANGEAPAVDGETAAPATPGPAPECEPAGPDGAEPREWF